MMKWLFLVLFLTCMASSPVPYVWSIGYAMDSDYPPFQTLPKNYRTYPIMVSPKDYIHSVQENSVVWVSEHALKDFYHRTLPHIKNRFVLVISDGDNSFPSTYIPSFSVYKLIHHPKIIHIFAQNVDIEHPKISPIPIGLDFHSMTKDSGYFQEPQHSVEEQVVMLDNILVTLEPTNLRKKKALVDFQLADRGIHEGESRTSIFKKIYPSELIDPLSHPIPRHELWRLKGEYAFSISPRGNGLDCHRTWEDLALGCIVIVKTSPLDPLYEGLPVVIIKDWSEINEENFDKWLAQYGDAFTNPSYREKLTQSYWTHKIRSKAK